MKAWSPPGRFRAPCGPKVGANSAPNGSWGRPGEPKQIIGWTPAPPYCDIPDVTIRAPPYCDMRPRRQEAVGP